jgi:hypothetical protein
MWLREHPGQEAWRKTSTTSGVGGEPLERRPPQCLLIIGAVARAWGGSRSGATAAHGARWSSERPPERCTAGAEPRHGVVAGAVADGDREREERTRCCADRERERIGVGKKVQWRKR